MLTYAQLAKQANRLQAMTSLRPDEFEALLPYFAEAYGATQSPDHTQAGQLRQRKAGGGRKAQLARLEDKLLFSLVYHKTYPLQTAHGLLFGLSQSQTNEWIHRLLPLLATALARAGYAPERDPTAFAQHTAPDAAPVAVQLDGTERPRQRPKNPAKQREHYSGKKSPH
jgi:hypothetical protein